MSAIRTSDWEAMARASMHETQLRIIEAMGDRQKHSPAELAEQLGETIGNVSYHVRRLRTMGLLIEAGTRQVRGAVEHYYRLHL